MNLATFYPFLKGIRRITKNIETNQGTPSQQAKYIYEKFYFIKGGFLEYLAVNFDRSDVNLKIRFDEFEIPERNADECNDFGFTTNDTNQIFCNQYDDRNANYFLVYQPDNPLAFEKELVIEMQCDSIYIIQNYEMVIYEILNEKQFWDSYRSLFVDYDKIASIINLSELKTTTLQPVVIEPQQETKRRFFQ
ncbi:MAG TPA: hypothetical protein VMZ29_09290 [Candidatus Bathyarchaeia archaeon]|nr:hypothetical protein [Candidatus Bathyarchaeia archaeon]